MSRHPKRQRKKDAAAARREARAAYMRRRRQRRATGVAVATVVLIGGGIAIALLVGGGGDTPLAASPGASADAEPTPQATLSPVACGAKEPAAAATKKPTFKEAGDAALEPGDILRLETSCGRIDIELDLERAPKTANSVAFLAKQKFYDGLTFHRIVPDFVLQGGDPKGDGTGGPGYQVVEAPPKETQYTEGLVAMAKAGNDPAGASGSQFFIVSGKEALSLTADYALLGKLVAGKDVVEKIEKLGNATGGPPSERVFINSATIVSG